MQAFKYFFLITKQAKELMVYTRNSVLGDLGVLQLKELLKS